MNKRAVKTIVFLVTVIIAFSLNSFLGLALILGGITYMIYGNLPTIFMVIGNRKYMSKNIDEAMFWYERSYKFRHAKPMVMINYAYVILKQGQVEKSEAVLREVLKRELNERDKSNANINLSLVLWKKGDLQGAISLMEEMYNKDYKTTLVYQNLGFYYILSGDLNKALEFNLEAYNYSDSDPSILDNLAINYYLFEDYEKALEVYNKLVPMKPSFVTTYYYYGLTLEKLERYEEALEVLNKALNYRFSFLSAVSIEQVKTEIEAITGKISQDL
jgi:tetratricopeptide (TPR) repeat protein